MASTIQPGGGAGTNSGSGSSAGVSNKVTVSSNDNTVNTEQTSRVPSYPCFQHATKLAIIEDNWTSSLDKSCLIGVRQNNEKLLVKSEDEYTSPIAKIYKVDSEYIIVTENSIYLVSSDISTRRIN